MLEQDRMRSYQQARNSEPGVLYFTQGTPLVLLTEESALRVYGESFMDKTHRR